MAYIIFNFTGVLLTCNNTACGGIREPNAVAVSSYIYIYIYIYIFQALRRARAVKALRANVGPAG